MTTKTYKSLFDVATNDLNERADLKFRADMMLTLRGLFEAKGWKQAEIGKALGIKQPHVSDLTNGHIDKFSSDKLLGFLAKLDIRLKPFFDNGEVYCEVHKST
ncbi:helix-turn-helix domain-containing protein [Pararhizobium sp. BT-229]|uniref:helix-turn-helix domain-containing protein n=1 Tax=Pararhizobium sp. BT-229 TaxID=2986923 RepID=UPI0021F7722B|nr:helix-turn-helix transcriptional regulator [Pararhizobium sp. BT-229]MCV9964491.1 helix-turn-helix domain-containing protein [Pararhizobium sp. BT-229]